MIGVFLVIKMYQAFPFMTASRTSHMFLMIDLFFVLFSHKLRRNQVSSLCRVWSVASIKWKWEYSRSAAASRPHLSWVMSRQTAALLILFIRHCKILASVSVQLQEEQPHRDLLPLFLRDNKVFNPGGTGVYQNTLNIWLMFIHEPHILIYYSFCEVY